MHTISCMGGLLQQSPTVRVLHPSLSDSHQKMVGAGGVYSSLVNMYINNIWPFDVQTERMQSLNGTCAT